MRLADIVTFDRGVYVVRRQDAERIGLSIRVRAAGDGADSGSLPPGRPAVAAFEGLPGGAEVDLLIRPRSLVRRLRHGSQRERVAVGARPFRLLFIGSGRCGTATVADWLDGKAFRDGTPVTARHESLAHAALPALLDGDGELFARLVAGQGHNVEAGAFYALQPDTLSADRIVHLVRDGRRVVQSGVNRGWYQSESLWNRIKPDFPGDVFEKCCRLWTRTCEDSDRVAAEAVRLEDLVGDAAARAGALARWGIADDGGPFPHANKGKASSGFSGWSREQQAMFTEICGTVMDRHYPGWQENW